MSFQIDACLLVTVEAEKQMARPVHRERAVAAAIVCDGRVLAMPRMAVAYPGMLPMQDVLEKLRRWRLWLRGKCWLDS